MCSDIGSAILRFNNNGVRQWATYWGEGTGGCNLLYDAHFTACDKLILSARSSSASVSYPGYYNQATGQQAYLMQLSSTSYALEWASKIGVNTGVPKTAYTPYQTRLYLIAPTYSQVETTSDPGGGAFYDGSFTGPHYAAFYITEFTISAAPPAVTGPTLVCGGQTGVSYTVPAVSGATYTWTVPTGATITSGQGTNSITVTFGNNGGDVCLTLAGSCVQTTPTCLTVVLDLPSVEPTSITATPGTICENNSTTLTLNGGTLGTGAAWHWYSGSCGGTSAGSGTSITVSPATTTTYYVQAIGSCNTTPCQSVQITVVPMPDPGLDGALTVCSSDSPANLFGSIGGSPDTGGIWVNPSGSQITQPVDPATAESGNYLYIVSGSDPCGPDTAIVTLTVNEAPKLDSIVVTDNTACIPPYNGQVVFYVSGAGGSYSYTIDGGTSQGSNTFTALSGGNHTYSITGTNTCSISGSFTINSSTGLSIDSLLYTNISCNGGTNGTITIYAGAAVSFSINNGASFQASGVFTGLGAGTYNIVVEDAGNCQALQNVTINEPPVLAADTTVVHALCGPTGSVTLTVTGGSPPYTYNWSNSATTQAITDIAAGTYAVTVSDANSCQQIISNIIVNDLGGSGSASVTNLQHISCFGASDGSITVAMPLGNPPVTYEWSHNTSLNTPTATGLGQGLYFVTLTDSYGCSVVLNGTINEPPVLSGNYVTSNVICYGTSTGGVDLTVTGGTSPYSYNWSNLITTQDLTNVPAGYYNVTVTDNNGCTWSASNILVRDAAEIIATYTVTDVLCHGSSTGSISTEVIGGQTPYTYEWSNGSQTAGNLQLTAGTYYCTITDFNYCVSIDTIIVSEPDEFIVNFNITHLQCHNSPTGQIAVITEGGNSPYTYEWSHSSVISDSMATGLLFGQYTVTIYDAHGCSITGSAEVFNSDNICLVIPDLFTPNGDGVNETFEILGIEAFPEAIMQIYNRWGDLLFKSTFYNDFWNGSWNGEPMPMGPYVFILDLRNGDDPIQGIVTIVY
jgi:gliding motility-associated-like protein